MDVLHSNNIYRGQSGAARRPFKSGPLSAHSVTRFRISAQQFELSFACSIFPALTPDASRRKLKSTPNRAHSFTKIGTHSQTINAVDCSPFQALLPESRHAYARACSSIGEQSRSASGEPFRVGLTNGSSRSLCSLGLAKANPLT